MGTPTATTIDHLEKSSVAHATAVFLRRTVGDEVAPMLHVQTVRADPDDAGQMAAIDASLRDLGPDVFPLSEEQIEGVLDAHRVIWQGITAPPLPPPPPLRSAVPNIVAKNKAKKLLLQMGLLAQVEAAIAAAPSPGGDFLRIDWADATHLRRDAPYIGQIGALLDPPLSSEQMDAMFIAADALP